MTDMGRGSATVIAGDEGGREMVTDGPCLLGTLDNLRRGYNADPVLEESVMKVKADALSILERVLRAIPAPKGQPPTGLLYGRVQSGKTMAMIGLAAAALDNGFRVVVVLTSDYLKLVQQTARRLGAVEGPLIKDSTGIETWHADIEHVRRQIQDHGIVLVCQKNQSHLRTLVEFIQSVGAGSHPALVLDDEADQATLDTTTAARSAQRPNAPGMASAVHRRTVRNDAPSEEEESIREQLPHSVFVQVTATPYALLLQNADTPLRPSFTHLLEPATGYTGGEAFFDGPHVDAGAPPLVFVDEGEGQLIQAGATTAPLGLQKAISFFLLGAAAQSIAEPRARAQKFLCHTSQKTDEHQRVADLIRSFLGRVEKHISGAEADPEIALRLDWAYEELSRTLVPTLPMADLLAEARKRLPRREIPIVNSAASPAEFGPNLSFIVGGNILGRGLTIENLLVTYYVRRARISQMDTVLQHARMFGYRERLMPITRVFLPESLAFRFHSIHVAEEHLRAMLAKASPGSPIAVQTVPGLRATRLNVLDAASLSSYGPGDQVYPIAPALGSVNAARHDKVEQLVKTLLGGVLMPHEFRTISMEDAIALVRQVPYSEDDPGSWDPEAVGNVLSSISEANGGTARLFYRPMERRKLRLSTGAVSGAELDAARAEGKPVIFVFRDSGKHLGQPFWYPTVVFPSDMATQVFNKS